MAVHRRFIKRKERLQSSGWVDGMLALMILIGISGFVLEAARIGVSFPEFEVVSFVGYGLALAFRGMGLDSGGLEALHQGTWVTHAAFSIGFFGVATVYFFRHIVVSMLSVALKPERPWGELRPYTVGEEADSEVPGTTKHVTWKDLLDADACTQCGRCTSVCPATAAGKALDPRNVVLKLSSLVDRRLDSNGSTPSAFEEVADQELWDCTTCGACVSECPVDIEVYQKIIDLRRNLVELGRVPQEAGESLDGVANRANPWNRPPGQRMAWAGTNKPPVVSEEHTPEIIYWIGCAGAYEPDGQSVTKSVIDIMKQAGLDFAVLGSGERCTGDPARRVGDEALFQEYKAKNLETLHNAGAKRVVTHCPHCFNTFKNEYQDENNPLEFEVIHHSQLIDELIKESKIELEREQKEQITFHDPCYLGRHNGEYDAPRNVLGSLPGISSTEMERSKRSSFCCGGGGGQMWLRQEGASEQVENIRLKEAEGTGAQTVATGCPFCKIMFQGSSRRAQQESPQQIKDISELVSERMKR
jgi:Fe-S oxidoreductase